MSINALGAMTIAVAAAYPVEAIVQQTVAQLPWVHNAILLDKVKNLETLSPPPIQENDGA
jgi:hypothetical protein